VTKINTDPAKKAKKHRPGEPVVKHSSNKRKRVGLDTISEDAKTATFNAIPNAIKVDLFNNVVKAAFPNFNNLMMASWNVVSIYSNVGTDFPELHKAIVDLKSVLQDFEQSLGNQVERKDPKPRRDLVPSSHAASHDGADDTNDGHPVEPTPDATQDDGSIQGDGAHRGGVHGSTQDDSVQNVGAEDPSRSHYSDAEVEVEPQHQEQDWDDQEAQPQQQEDDVDSLFNEPKHQPDATAMPPPRTLKRPRLPSETGDEQNPAPVKPHLSSHRTSSPHMRTSSPRLSSASPAPRASSIELQRRRSEYRTSSSLAVRPPSFPYSPSASANPSADEYDSTPETLKPEKKPLNEVTIASLRSTYKTRKARLIKTFGGNSNVPQQYRMQMQELMREIKGREAREAEEREREETVRREEQEEFEDTMGGGVKEVSEMPKFLGNSVLGGKKVGLGMAPVAPMMHLKKDGAGGKKGQ
jgi:hypothetical protein